ncbi:MAG: Asp-tRNA(Asn)/Glu-tRNA(Gln) amidotransferase subunit GatA [Patescibacteria group bacterium]|nr:Asp-tRNA(Asn)/Glu-tRNA(Gln) amidotransferase subunit GatA [Patescibacteria group bacterium]
MKSLSISSAIKSLKNKEISSAELVSACLSKIKEKDSSLNSFITVCGKEALRQAKKADELILKGEADKKPLLGIPIAIKDLYSTKGIKTTAGSKLLKDYTPVYDATSVSRLRKAGAIIIGKTNLDAWGHGSSGENSDFGPTKNPFDENFVPGGSSSGSAASLASDMALASTGTDTGGSIRLPASFCNLFGLKPTYGLVSRYGVIAMASSLDCMGHFTKTVEDSARLLKITAGKDNLDATSSDKKVPDYLSFLDKPIGDLKIGIPKEYFEKGIDKKILKRMDEVIKFYKKLGIKVLEVSLPHTKYALSSYYVIMPSEVSSNLARFDGIRYASKRNEFSLEAKRRIMIGTYTLSSGYYDQYYLKAMKARTLIIKDFENVFSKVNLLLSPVSPQMPFKLGEKIDDPIAMYMSDVLTAPASLAGLPALSVPAGFIDKLPIGFQLIGDRFSEELLFQAANAYERENK